MSISERRWDCLWDRVSISKQRVDCSKNQFGGVDCFGNSLRVSRGDKDPIIIKFVLSNSVCFRIVLRNQLRRWLEKVHHRENL